mmetsp:Transcript_13046/g.28967  ORF Transcript_13046/g.28967 Transcript_13046/m.28967 type:complete len:209 (-) Transcript_13046:2955-3581(-)
MMKSWLPSTGESLRKVSAQLSSVSTSSERQRRNRERRPPSSRKRRCEAVEERTLLTAREASRCTLRCFERIRNMHTWMAFPCPARILCVRLASARFATVPHPCLASSTSVCWHSSMRGGSRAEEARGRRIPSDRERRFVRAVSSRSASISSPRASSASGSSSLACSIVNRFSVLLARCLRTAVACAFASLVPVDSTSTSLGMAPDCPT